MQDQSKPGDRARCPLRPGVRVETTIRDAPRGSVRRGTVVECGARVVWDDEREPVYAPARDLRPVGGS